MPVNHSEPLHSAKRARSTVLRFAKVNALGVKRERVVAMDSYVLVMPNSLSDAAEWRDACARDGEVLLEVLDRAAYHNGGSLTIEAVAHGIPVLIETYVPTEALAGGAA